MSDIRRVQNSEHRDRESPVNVNSKRDDQKHQIQVFYIITVSCCVSCSLLSFSSLLLSLCAMVHDVGVILRLKSASELEFQTVTISFWLASLADPPSGVITVISGGGDKLEPTYQLVANLEQRRMFQTLSQGNWSSLLKRIHTNIRVPTRITLEVMCYHHHQQQHFTWVATWPRTYFTSLRSACPSIKWKHWTWPCPPCKEK